jgi:signal peptidase I
LINNTEPNLGKQHPGISPSSKAYNPASAEVNLDVTTLSDTQPTRRKRSIRSGCVGFFIDTVETLLLALVLFLIINAVSDRVRVENISMQPSLYSGEFVLVNKLAYKLGQPNYGDIVVFPAPPNPKERYIKRVIGMPGDQVRVSNGNVYVNNVKLTEPYIAAQTAYDGEWDVPAGSLFVLGDNRNASSDSHVWGFVSIDKVIGRALVIYWPFQKFQILEHPNIVKAAQ